MRALGVVVLGLAACGSVSGKEPDARIDSPPMADVAIDTPVQVIPTALGLDAITTFAVPPQTFTKVPYTTELYDDGDEYDTSTNRFTAKAAGDYEVCATLYIVNVAFELDVFINDARERAFAYGTTVAEGCHTVRLKAGDHVDVRVWHAEAASESVSNVPAWTALTIRKSPATVLATGTTAFSVPSSTFTLVPYDHDVYDDANTFDTTAHTFIAPQAGDFQICASIAGGNGPTLRTEMDLFVNNTRKVGFAHDLGSFIGCHTLRLAASDAVDVRIYQTQASSVSIPADSSWQWITVVPRTATVYEGNISSFTMAAGTFVKVPYTGEIYDENGEFDVSTSTFTAKTAGDYEVCASFDIRIATFRTEIDVYKNGNREKGLAYTLGATGGHCRVLRLAANDQINIYAYQESGTSQTITVLDPLWDWFQVTKL